MDRGGQGAIRWTRLVVPNVRRQRGGGSSFMHSGYNLGISCARWATPEPIKDWSLTSLKGQADQRSARKVVSHGRYVIFQNGRARHARQMFQEILRLIAVATAAAHPPALA